ncbi:DUF502 domain-containing protein [Ramlibacter rhizophilus]|uniref:DUF502 domain-containing protein n=1 Tax=Ramlibacter rhizophilus TaxID=1781167 RepID=A0A4Z0BGK7_9BURK|nr:DUF502 domain-containing protein [Ramlibacter rhizophilus]TFY98456.1 DUF502 domain-containing protein [Ramlibacter rhizophilus]
MKRLYKYFFRGLLAVLPLAVTVYVLFLFLGWVESLFLGVLGPVIGSFYVPGMGLLSGVAIIVGIGAVLSKRKVREALAFIELPFTRLPVVKSIYSALKSFSDYFDPGTRANSQQVVILRMPDHELEVVGLVTRRRFADLPAGFLPGERVAVYLPMGYMIGGYTVFVPASWVTPINMSVEEAMRSSLIAWMQTRPDPAQQARTQPTQHPRPGF